MATEPVWTSRDGTETLVRKMNPFHLDNVIAKLERQARMLPSVPVGRLYPIYKDLIMERAKRREKSKAKAVKSWEESTRGKSEGIKTQTDSQQAIEDTDELLDRLDPNFKTVVFKREVGNGEAVVEADVKYRKPRLRKVLRIEAALERQAAIEAADKKQKADARREERRRKKVLTKKVTTRNWDGYNPANDPAVQEPQRIRLVDRRHIE